MQGPRDGTELVVFGAYLDDRKSVSEYGVVRVFTVTSVPDKLNVICQLWYEGSESPTEVASSHENVGRGLKVRAIKYQERMYTCPLPKGVSHPVNLSLVFEHCQQSTMLVKIVKPERQQVHDIGICVAISYGTLDPYRLVEWIELNQILGVGEFNLYDSHLHKTSRQVLDHYEKLGIVKVRPSAPAVPSWCYWCQKLTVIPAFNDCLYRNMYRYKHTLVIDVDEFIIPQKETNLKDLIKVYSQRTNNFPALIFRNAYFFLDFESEPMNSQDDDLNRLVTMRYFNRLPPSEQNYAPKSLLNPQKCVVVQNHYCAVRTPDVGKYWTEVVPPEHALNHHYKKCHYNKKQCSDLKKAEHIHDETVLRFKERLHNAVKMQTDVLKKEGVIL